MSWWIYMALMIGGGVLGCGMTFFGCLRAQRQIVAAWVAACDHAEKVGFHKGAASREAEVMDLKVFVKLYTHTCSIMRDALQKAGWSEEVIKDEFGDLGIPAVHLGEREGCVLVPAVFDMHKQCLGLVGYGLRLETEFHNGWRLMVIEQASGNFIGVVDRPAGWWVQVLGRKEGEVPDA